MKKAKKKGGKEAKITNWALEGYLWNIHYRYTPSPPASCVLPVRVGGFVCNVLRPSRTPRGRCWHCRGWSARAAPRSGRQTRLRFSNAPENLYKIVEKLCVSLFLDARCLNNTIGSAPLT